MQKFILRLILKFIKNKKNISKTHSIKACSNLMHKNNVSESTVKTEIDKKTQESKEKIEEIVRLYHKQPTKILEYIKNNGTEVICKKNAEKFLKPINEEKGIIFPKKGFEALYLNLIFNKKISFKTNELFITDSYNMDNFTLIYSFYKWFSYKEKISGYEVLTQNRYKLLSKNKLSQTELNNLPYQELCNLKNALAKDKEAAEFAGQFIEDGKKIVGCA